MGVYRKIKIAGRTYSLHRYVWEQAYGPVPEGYVVHHVNHDKLDNRLENLQLMTHAEHSRHHNDRHPRRKICVTCGESYEPAATHRNRQQTCSWECRSDLLSQKQTANSGTRKLNAGQKATIARRLAGGERGVDLAREYGVSKSTISRTKEISS